MKYASQIILIFTLFGTASCQPASVLEPGQTLQLATSAENKVEVTIALTRDESGQFILSATFTPQLLNMHLYSKEIPRNGVDGVGRPTLLELAEGSALKANGELTESVAIIPVIIFRLRRTSSVSRRSRHFKPACFIARWKRLGQRRSHRHLHGM